MLFSGQVTAGGEFQPMMSTENKFLSFTCIMLQAVNMKFCVKSPWIREVILQTKRQGGERGVVEG